MNSLRCEPIKAPTTEWEKAYEDWHALLVKANATDLLDDPLAIWDEAWRQASMLTIEILMAHNKINPDIEQLINHIQKRLLK